MVDQAPPRYERRSDSEGGPHLLYVDGRATIERFQQSYVSREFVRHVVFVLDVADSDSTLSRRIARYYS